MAYFDNAATTYPKPECVYDFMNEFSRNCGGSFGYFLKKAGLDAVILKGRCKNHTWLIHFFYVS